MEVKSFNEMTDEDIVNTLKEVSRKYGVTYDKVGYCRENGENKALIVLNYKKDLDVDIRHVEFIIYSMFIGLGDIDGNDIESDDDESYDDNGPCIDTLTTEDKEFIDMWIRQTERSGKITWLKVE